MPTLLSLRLWTSRSRVQMVHGPRSRALQDLASAWLEAALSLQLICALQAFFMKPEHVIDYVCSSVRSFELFCGADSDAS